MIGVIALPSACFAEWKPSDEDLENCMWRDGRPMSEKNCTEFRAEVAHEKAVKARQEQYLQEQRRRMAEQNEEKARQEAIREENSRKYREEQQEKNRIAQERFERELKEEEAQERAAQKAAAARENSMREKCGADFRQIRIGMTLSRAQQCVGKFILKSQINRADGVVSTYANGATYINVMDERIVSWQKF
jgi:flagellar biosynthesis GTPase FlhF